MRSLFKTQDEEFVFVSSTDEKFLLTNDGFMPTDIETADLEPVAFDITIQAVVDNAQIKFNAIKAEIATAIANFESPE